MQVILHGIFSILLMYGMVIILSLHQIACSWIALCAGAFSHVSR